jgi:hypothetical protein
MSDGKNVKKLTLEALRQQAAEALKTEPGYQIDLDNDESVFVAHPLFVDDSVSAAVQNAENPVEIAKAVLGEEDHAKLLANGGRSADVSLAWALMQSQASDVTPSGDPTL